MTASASQYDPFVAPEFVFGDFSRVYEDHHRNLLGVALRTLHDRVLAEDVVHDVLLDLWHRPWRFEPARGSLAAYLSCVTHRRAVDALRGRVSRRQREERVASAPQQHQPNGEDAYMEQWDAEEIARRLRASASALSPRQREAISAAFGDSHSYRANAERLGIPEGTFKSRVRDGLKEMRRQLRELDTAST